MSEEVHCVSVLENVKRLPGPESELAVEGAAPGDVEQTAREGDNAAVAGGSSDGKQGAEVESTTCDSRAVPGEELSREWSSGLLDVRRKAAPLLRVALPWCSERFHKGCSSASCGIAAREVKSSRSSTFEAVERAAGAGEVDDGGEVGGIGGDEDGDDGGKGGGDGDGGERRSEEAYPVPLCRSTAPMPETEDASV